MNEYYIVANSFAAPFVSDTSKKWWNGINSADALLSFVKEYKHPCGLYVAWIYEDANHASKNPEKPLRKWESNAAIYGEPKFPGQFDPKEGQIK